jgi:hypothetical protein
MTRTIALAAGLSLSLASVATAQSVVFDSITSAANLSIPSNVGSPTGSGNRYLGQVMNLSNGQGATPTIVGFDTTLLNATGASITLTSLRLRYWVWGTASLSLSGSTPAFSDLLQSGTVNFTLGPSGFTLANSSFT